MTTGNPAKNYHNCHIIRSALYQFSTCCPYLEVGEVLAEDEELVLARGLVELSLVPALVGVGVAVVGVLVEGGPGVFAHHLAAGDVDGQVALPGIPSFAVPGSE